MTDYSYKHDVELIKGGKSESVRIESDKTLKELEEYLEADNLVVALD